MRRPKVRRWLLIAGAVLVLYTLIGFFAVPPLLRSILDGKLTKALDRKTTIESVSVNPFVLSVRVRGLTVRERGSDAVFFSLGQLYANFKLSSLVHLAPVVSELRLVDPYAHLVREKDKSYNFSDLLAPPKTPPAEPAKPLRYALDNIQLSGGRIEFDDRPMDKVHRITGLYLALPFISNMRDDTNIFVKPALRAVVNGTPVDLGGESKPFSRSLDTSLAFEFSRLNVPTYLAYMPVPPRVRVPSALLGGRLKLTFRQEKGKVPELALSGEASLSDVRITDGKGAELVDVPLLRVRIAEAELLAGTSDLESVLVQKPRVWVARDAKGAVNLAALLPASGGGSAPQGAAGPGRVLKVGRFEVTDGTVDVSDASVAPAFKATLSAVGLDVRGFSTAAGAKAAVELSAASDAGETLKETGEMTWSPMTARGTLELAGVPLRRYAAYYEDSIGFEVADGVFGMSTGYTWDGGSDGWTLSGLAATLRALRLHRPGAKGDFLAVPETKLADSTIDLHTGSAVLGDLALSGARLAVTRSAAGEWNLAALVPPAPAPPNAAAAPAATPPAGRAAPAWTIGVTRLALERATIEVDDALPKQPVHVLLAPLTLTGSDLSTAPGKQGRLEVRSRVNGSGRVSLSGAVGLEPFTAKLATKVEGVPLVPLQGYITDRLHLAVNDGTASAAGTLTFAAGGPSPGAGFTGQASVDQLATVDAYAAQDLVRWTSLAADGVSFASAPFHLGIDQVSLSGLVTDLVVERDGTLNLKKVLGAPQGAPSAAAASGGAEEAVAVPEAVVGPEAAAAAPAAVPAATPPPAAPVTEAGTGSTIRIGKVTLSGGSIVFVDHSVEPEVRIGTTDLGGSVSGLTSLASTAADVDLHATLNGVAPLTITGKINPLAGDLFLDAKLGLSDFNLLPLSPYCGIYAGYAIESGKLDMNLAYTLDRLHLKAANAIELDQFDFGQKVDSPKAIHAPLRLAVSLLKNRDGVININLPVSGSLGDPRFKLGRIILKMIGHLLEKVATSPFSLLGKLFGGGQAQLDAVAFAPGTATLDAAAQHALDTLAKALYERPGLRLDITGRTDTAADTEGLRQLGLERAIKRERLNEIIKEGGTAPSLDAVVVPPAEVDTYLTLAYKHGKFKKPRTWLGFAKKEPVPEMKKLLLASFTPGPDALRNLASARAEAVQSFLLGTGKVKPDQLFIVGVQGAATSVRDKAPGARVDLSLK